MRLFHMIPLLFPLFAGLFAEEQKTVSATILHRFLAMDEGRGILHYFDERDQSKNWHLQLSKQIRDFQPIGNNKILMAQWSGYTIYDLKTKTLIEEVKIPGLVGCISARRRLDGTTILGTNTGGARVLELSATNAVLRTMAFPKLDTMRMIRPTQDGNILLGDASGTSEVTFDAQSPQGGRVIRHIPLPYGKFVFMALKKTDGNYLASAGFAKAFFEFGPDGTIRRELKLKDPPPGASPFFFAGFQVRKNGNVVVCNWTGHGASDSAKGWQLLEFAPDGSLVWHWHDPKISGTLVNIAILDDLDEGTFFDDSSGILLDKVQGVGK